MYECPICKRDPTSHSLRIVNDTDTCVYLYTRPSEARLYNDTEGILRHYWGVLSDIPSTKQWEWVFDANGFTLTHAMEITLATRMAQMITDNFSHNLRSIRVINPTMFISITINAIWPFLSKEVRDIIHIER
jgi:hypothetical protein